MDNLQRTMNRAIEEAPRAALADLLEGKLRAQGIRLSKKRREALAERILTEKCETVSFAAGPRKSNITIDLTEDDIQAFGGRIERLAASLPNVIEELTEGES